MLSPRSKFSIYLFIRFAKALVSFFGKTVLTLSPSSFRTHATPMGKSIAQFSKSIVKYQCKIHEFYEICLYLHSFLLLFYFLFLYIFLSFIFLFSFFPSFFLPPFSIIFSLSLPFSAFFPSTRRKLIWKKVNILSFRGFKKTISNKNKRSYIIRKLQIILRLLKYFNEK